MKILLKPFLFTYIFLSVNFAFADVICEKFSILSPSEQDKHILSIVDFKLNKWSQNKKIKTMMSDSERINMLFKNTKNKISLACKNKNEFEAGIALGEDLAVYKIALLRLK